MTLISSISGIRGTIGGKTKENLTPLDIVHFASAYAQWILGKCTKPKIVIGRDARLSGPMLSQLVAATLQGMGIDVIDLGLSTTPTVEVAVPDLMAQGGIILTASHNPIEWNALKLLNEKGEFINSSEGEKILQYVNDQNYHYSSVDQLGTYTFFEDYLEKHIEKILELKLVDPEAIKKRNFSVVVDGVNSSGSVAVPLLLQALGVKHIEKINGEANGQFAHNPEPLPENITQITTMMKNGTYDLGIVVDPDVDRLAFVCENGMPFGEEYTLVAVADYVLHHTPGSTVSNLSSSKALADITQKHNCNYYSSAVGEVNVVAKMKEKNAVIGGEGNGGVIYPELHYGRDALVGIALFLSFLAKKEKTSSKLRAEYTNYYMHKDKINLDTSIDLDQLLHKIAKEYSGFSIDRTDGVKIIMEEGWVHLRKSNTEPIIRIYTEAKSKEMAEILSKNIKSKI